MRKLGGLALLALVVLSGCATPEPSPAAAPTPGPSSVAPTPKWVNKAGEPFDTSTVKFNDSAVATFTTMAHSVKGYENAKESSMASLGRDICEHYASGFTTEDLRQRGGESLAKLGESAKATVCA